MAQSNIGQIRIPLLLALLAACASERPAQAPSTASALELTPADAELWTFQLELRGSWRGPSELEGCRIEVGDQSQGARTDGRSFSASIHLHAGPNSVRARCRTADGREIRSGPRHYDVRLRDVPTARAIARIEGDRLMLDGSTSQCSEDSKARITRYAWSGSGASSQSGLGEGMRLALPKPADGIYSYVLRAVDARGASDVARTRIELRSGELIDAADPDRTLEHAVVYGVLPPLYGEAPLRGVTRALPGLSELGATVLWLAPLFEGAVDDYGDAVTHYQRVRADYGTEQDLRELVSEAHRRGMRVILDLPANHTSREHRYFAQSAERGRRSHYFGFYARDANGAATHYFDRKHLANLDYDNPEVSRLMLETAQYWIREGGVDGYRVDTAWGVRKRSPDYWPHFGAELRRIQPGALLVAQGPSLDPYYQTHGFDMAYDWTRELGHHAWEHVFSSESGVAARLHAAMSDSLNGALRADRVLRFLNDNDSGTRFIARHGEGLTRVATAALLSLPGVPCLYSFDEAGAAFDPHGKLAPIGSEAALHPGLRDFHKRWIALRRTHPALTGSGFERVGAASSGDTYLFLRFDPSQEHVLLIALNFSKQPARIAVRMPQTRIRSPRLRDVMNGKTIELRGGRLELSLAGFEARALQPTE